MLTPPEERVPPHNLDAEESILGAMMLDHNAADTAIAELQAEDFYKEQHRDIFRTLTDLYQSGKPTDPVLLCEELKKRGLLDKVGDKYYVHSLVDSCPNQHNARHYAQVVHKASVRRKWIEEGYNLVNAAYSDNGCAAIVGRLEKTLCEVDRTPTEFTAEELMAMDLPEQAWVVPDILPEGLGLLVGKPKIGKSWMALGLALAIAAGGKALGSIDVEQGSVLYLALEDNPRRLRTRLTSILRYDAWPCNLTFEVNWPRLDDGGLTRLEAWVKAHPETRLVIVDTFAKVRQAGSRSAGIYQDDYNALSGLKDIADEYGIAILAVHHQRKAEGDDHLDQVSGSTGITGCADTVLTIQRQRGSADAVLQVSGRDQEEQELALGFDNSTTSWSVLGPADEYRRTQERQDVIELLHQTEEGMTSKDIAETLGKKPGTIRVLLMRMTNDGEISKPTRGLYTCNISNNVTSEYIYE